MEHQVPSFRIGCRGGMGVGMAFSSSTGLGLRCCSVRAVMDGTREGPVSHWIDPTRDQPRMACPSPVNREPLRLLSVRG